MELNITSAIARAMAKRLREATSLELTTSASMEVLAKTLGYPNWDTLSGMLKASDKVETPEEDADFVRRASVHNWRKEPPKDFTPFTLYAEAYACNEWAEGPSWCKLEVTPALVALLHELQTLALKQDLETVTRDCYELEWQDEDRYSLRSPELQVSKRSFWFTARPKHQDFDVECRYFDFEELFQLIEKGQIASKKYFAWADGILFRDGNSARALAELLLDEDEISIDEGSLDEMPMRD